MSDLSPWLQVFGRAHPVLLHAPLGLLPAVALFEFGPLLLRREVSRGSVLTLSLLCALTAALAGASGLVGAAEQADSELLGLHKITALVLGGLCVLLPIAAALRSRAPLRVLLLLALGVMVPAGHYGGSLVHGRNYLFAPLEPKRTPTPPPAPDATSTMPIPVGANGSEYTRVIAPIFERVCTNCHNPDKAKAELLLTTPEGILKGSENGPVLVPGKPAESPLLTRCELPLDDEDHMPPEGKAQPTAEELAALRRWIEAGAKF